MIPKEDIKKALDKLTTQQISIDLFNIISNGKYNMNDLVYYFDRIDKALNELERLKKFKATFDNYELAKKQGFIAYEIWQECERELTELKRDVARYFELANEGEVTKEVIDEFSKIRDKLMEVGKEE